ncbi:MAG TPA: hypothetical protein DHU55_14320 [Blastocatellia bacterium]|nr:hypothetical protein [Blastocatellia bacterium]HCX30922.1 hypothetical protein [Blastocatellia bacterium]
MFRSMRISVLRLGRLQWKGFAFPLRVLLFRGCASPGGVASEQIPKGPERQSLSARQAAKPLFSVFSLRA